MLQARPELADMQMSYGDEHRPLHFAVMKRSPEMVRLLMQHGADARVGIHPHRDATTALTLAEERGYEISSPSSRRKSGAEADGTANARRDD